MAPWDEEHTEQWDSHLKIVWELWFDYFPGKKTVYSAFPSNLEVVKGTCSPKHQLCVSDTYSSDRVEVVKVAYTLC